LINEFKDIREAASDSRLEQFSSMVRSGIQQVCNIVFM
jgi:hypothetical protein